MVWLHTYKLPMRDIKKVKRTQVVIYCQILKIKYFLFGIKPILCNNLPDMAWSQITFIIKQNFFGTKKIKILGMTSIFYKFLDLHKPATVTADYSEGNVVIVVFKHYSFVIFILLISLWTTVNEEMENTTNLN